MEGARSCAKSMIVTVGVSVWRSTDSLGLEGRGSLEFEPVFNGLGLSENLVPSLKRAALDSKGALWESLALTISSMVGICFSRWRARSAFLYLFTLFFFAFSAGDSGGIGSFSRSSKNIVSVDLFESWEDLLDRDGTGYGSPKNSVAADLADLAEHWEELLDRDGGRLGCVSEFPKNTVVVDLLEDRSTLNSESSDRLASLIDMIFLSLV